MRKRLLTQILEMGDLDADIEKLFKMRFFKIRFGRLTKRNFERLMVYAGELETVFIHIRTVGEYEHLLYIMPSEAEVKVDGIFSSLQFERIFIPEGFRVRRRRYVLRLTRRSRKKTDAPLQLRLQYRGLLKSIKTVC